MEIKHRDIKVCEYCERINTNCSVDADVIVPDTQPDIYRILCVNAVCELDEHHIRKGKIVFSGNVRFNIMYIGETERGKIYNIYHTAPFNHQCDLSSAGDDAVIISNCQVSSTGFNVKNSRKLAATCELNISASASNRKTVSAVESTGEEQFFEYREKNVAYDSMVNSNMVEFDVSDSLPLQCQTDSLTVHDFNARVNISEIKTVNNKAIIKGNVPIRLLYSCDGKMQQHETETSFTQIADLDGVNADSRLSYQFEVCRVDYCVGEIDSCLDATVGIKGFISAYDSHNTSLVCDVYSPDYKFSVNSSKEHFEKFARLSDSQFTLKDSLYKNTEIADISKIHYMNVYPSCNKISFVNNSLRSEGSAEAILIYSSDDGELFSVRKKIPFENDVLCDIPGDSPVFDAKVSVVNFGYVLGSSDEIQLRIVLRMCVDASSFEQTDVIRGFSFDENSPLDKTSQASITVCYPKKGEKIWDYAVKYNTTCKEIRSVNGIGEEEEFTSGCAIIIPKRNSK